MVLAKSEDIAPLGKALDFELGIFDFKGYHRKMNQKFHLKKN